jgi:hypothetical protein
VFRVLCTAEGEMRERGEKTDLKADLDGPKTEYVRTYRSTFDRTRAGAWVCVCVRRSNLHKQVRTHTCSAVGAWKGATVELHQGKVGRSAVQVRTYRSTFERLV